MTVAYARTDIKSVHVSDAHGGCGRPHLRTDTDGDGFPVDCVRCAPWLISNMSDQFGPHPSKLPLTHDEKMQLDIDAEEGKMLTASAGRALGEFLAEKVGGTPPPAAPGDLSAASLLEAINGLMARIEKSDEDRRTEQVESLARIAELEGQLRDARGEKGGN